MVMLTASPEKKVKEKHFADWKILSLKCSRCEGLMVTEEYADFRARRCVQCGEIIDPIILENRQRRLPIGVG